MNEYLSMKQAAETVGIDVDELESLFRDGTLRSWWREPRGRTHLVAAQYLPAIRRRLVECGLVRDSSHVASVAHVNPYPEMTIR